CLCSNTFITFKGMENHLHAVNLPKSVNHVSDKCVNHVSGSTPLTKGEFVLLSCRFEADAHNSALQYNY
ncbi:MAG: hypothetical protein M1269_12550, partial [Chloroflexi bacterium]|nr:hypothetical protein [Chloroflexota bacterium]